MSAARHTPLGQSRIYAGDSCSSKSNGERRTTIPRSNGHRLSINEFLSQQFAPKLFRVVSVPSGARPHGHQKGSQPFATTKIDESEEDREGESVKRKKRNTEAERRVREPVSRHQSVKQPDKEKRGLQFEDTSRQEAAVDIPLVVQGSVAIFAAGLEIRKIITSFDARQIILKNVPVDVQRREIESLLTEQGLDATGFYITRTEEAVGKGLDVSIVTDAKSAAFMAAHCNQIPCRGEYLAFSINTFHELVGWSKKLLPDPELLVSFKPSSAQYLVELPEYLIEEQIQRLNRRMYQEREIQTTRLPVFPSGLDTHTFRPNLKLSNLPYDITDGAAAELAGTILHFIRRIPITRSDFDSALNDLYAYISEHFPDQLVSCDVLSRRGQEDNMILRFIRIGFSDHRIVEVVGDSLQGKHFGSIRVEIVPKILRRGSVTYTTSISREQYRAQKSQWDELYGSITDRTTCNLKIDQQDSTVLVHVIGNTKAAIGALKVRVENLIAGEKVEGWHPLLASLGGHLAQRVREAGAYVTADPRHQTVALYGRSREVRAARQVVEKELIRLSNISRVVDIPRSSIDFFARQGLPALREMFGRECVQLDPVNSKVTVRGSADVHHLLTRLIKESQKARKATTTKSAGGECPICLGGVAAPYKLGCGHEYCAACLHHFFTAAIGAKKFPLVCLTCVVPISISIIQRFLPTFSFNQLIEEAFNTYVNRHLEEIKSCPTPGCIKQYRSSKTPIDAECPSCLTRICTACGMDGHNGQPCAHEQEVLSEKWIARQPGIRKCPKCRRLLEKRGGCNHISCPCGAHICWQCMGAFSSDQIYTHMSTTHGGIDTMDEPPPPSPAVLAPVPDLLADDPFLDVDYYEQFFLLEQTQLLEQARLQQQAAGRIRSNTDASAPVGRLSVRTAHKLPAPSIGSAGRSDDAGLRWADDEITEF